MSRRYRSLGLGDEPHSSDKAITFALKHNDDN